MKKKICYTLTPIVALLIIASGCGLKNSLYLSLDNVASKNTERITNTNKQLDVKTQ